MYGPGNPGIRGDGPRTVPAPPEAVLLPGRRSPAPRARGTSCRLVASSALRLPSGSLEIWLERSPNARSSAGPGRPLSCLLDLECVIDLRPRPYLPRAEPQDRPQVRWERVDDSPEHFPELLRQEAPLRRRARIQRRLGPMAGSRRMVR